jgi:hypothetical protein
LLKLFDVSKKKAKAAEDELSSAMDVDIEDDVDNDEELEKLASGIELEELITELGQDNGDADDVEGLVDELELLDEEERSELEKSIQPVKIVMVKVSK